MANFDFKKLLDVPVNDNIRFRPGRCKFSAIESSSGVMLTIVDSANMPIAAGLIHDDSVSDTIVWLLAYAEQKGLLK